MRHINMMFFLASDKLSELIEKIPAGNVKAFVKNFCNILR